MRVLTVRQPWAWAIIHGDKTVENRSRNIAGAYRGPVAIHAGLTFEASAWGEVEWTSGRAFHEADDRRGAIIGVVDLVDVHHDMGCSRKSPGPAGYRANTCSPWSMYDHHHLILSNPRALATPIPAKGRLGLWKPDTDLEQAINDALDGDA